MSDWDEGRSSLQNRCPYIDIAIQLPVGNEIRNILIQTDRISAWWPWLRPCTPRPGGQVVVEGFSVYFAILHELDWAKDNASLTTEKLAHRPVGFHGLVWLDMCIPQYTSP